MDNIIQEVERALLGKFIVDSDSLGFLGDVDANHFSTFEHQEILKAIKTSALDGNVSFAAVLKNVDEKQEDYLRETMRDVSRAGQTESLIKAVLEAAEKREIKQICENYIHQSGLKRSSHLVENLVSDLLKIKSQEYSKFSYSSSELSNIYFDELSKRGKEEATIKFGFYDLDRLTYGARNSNLIIVAGRPSQGKSAFLENLLTNVLEQKKSVYYVSAESSKEEIMDRVVGRLSGLGHEKLKTDLDDNSSEKVTQALAKFSEYKLTLNDSPTITSEQILFEAKKLKLQNKLDIIFVDYLQFLHDQTLRSDNEERRIAKISMMLKTISRTLNVPLICAAQLNRGLEQRGDPIPKLSDLRQSGQIEQDADLVLGLWRPDRLDPVTNFRILKHRHGNWGEFRLVFNGKLTQFLNLAYEDKN